MLFLNDGSDLMAASISRFSVTVYLLYYVSVPVFRHLRFPQEMEPGRIFMACSPWLAAASLYGEVYLPVRVTYAEAYRCGVQHGSGQSQRGIVFIFFPKPVERHRRYLAVGNRHILHGACFLLDFGKFLETGDDFTESAFGEIVIFTAYRTIFIPGFALQLVHIRIHHQFRIFTEKYLELSAPFAPLPGPFGNKLYETEHLFVGAYIHGIEIIGSRPDVVGMLPCLNMARLAL